MSIRPRHWIGGEWVDSDTVVDSIDPTTGETIGTSLAGGSYKQSGLGRLNGVSAVDDFVEHRTIIHEISKGDQSP